jgi:hypothetical protein
MSQNLPMPAALESFITIETVKHDLKRCLSVLDQLGLDRAAICVNEAIWILTSPQEQSAIAATVDAQLAECFGG